MAEVFRVDAPFRGPYRLERLSFGSGSPTLAVVAGLHGNELNGIHALNVLAATLRMSRLQGTVHVLPIVNTFGLEQGTKRWPYDDRDINQAFPGDPDGSVVQRIAHSLLEHTQADVCLDVHSASPLMRELPQVRVPLSGEEVELGRAMGLPVVWRRAGVGVWTAHRRDGPRQPSPSRSLAESGVRHVHRWQRYQNLARSRSLRRGLWRCL